MARPSTLVAHAAAGVALAAVVAARQEPPLSFTDVSAAAGLDVHATGAHGACWADVTGNGWPDLYITYNDIESGFRRSRLFINRGDGTFSEEGLDRGVASENKGAHGCAWADLDNDGDYDLLQGLTFGGDGEPFQNRVFRNDAGTFTLVPTSLGDRRWPTRAILAPDVDADGLLDVAAVTGFLGSGDPPDERNEFYRNTGGLTFASVETSAWRDARIGQGATDVDIDGDGDVDIITCDREGPLVIFLNSAGRLLPVSAPARGIDRRCYTGVSVGDVDGDGDQDAILLDPGPFREATLYLNDGDGTFSFAGRAGGVIGFSAALADLDHDGDLDAVIPGQGRVYLGTGDGGFLTGPAVPAFDFADDPRSVALADYDRDGDLDVVITAARGGLRLLRNDRGRGHWLQARLRTALGQAGAFGAELRVRDAATGARLAVRQARSNYGYLAQNDPVLHVGLGDRTMVDLEVRFVSGTRVSLDDVAVDQRVEIDGATGTVLERPGRPGPPAATVTGSTVSLGWTAPSEGGPPGSYLIEAGSGSGLADVIVLDTHAGRTSFTTQSPPGAYYVRVRPHNAAGFGPASEDVLVVVGDCRPPEHLTADVTGRTVVLRWSGAGARYLVQAGSAPGASDVAEIVATTTSPAFAGVPPGVYYVRVRAPVGCAVVPASNEVRVEVL